MSRGGNTVLSGIPGMSGNYVHAQTVDARPSSPIFRMGPGTSLLLDANLEYIKLISMIRSE